MYDCYVDTYVEQRPLQGLSVSFFEVATIDVCV